MALILNIETSSPVCSVCLSRDGHILADQTDMSGTHHAALLTVFIRQLCKETGIALQDINAVAVSAGPGSYTGLRIGTVTAKGLCYSLSKPFIAIDSLQILSYGLAEKYQNNSYLFCPTIDARRDEIYFGLFERSGRVILSSTSIILDSKLPFTVQGETAVIVGGSGTEKCSRAWQESYVLFDFEVVPTSRFMTSLAENKFNNSQFENILSFEPHYLRPVHITQSKK